MVPLFYDLTTFYILGQKFVKIFVGFLENLRYQKGILKLIDLYKMIEIIFTISILVIDMWHIVENQN